MKYVQMVKTTVLLLALLVVGRISAAASEELLGGKENPILSLMSLRVGLSSFCIWERDALAVSAKEYEKYRASKMQKTARALTSKGRMPAGHASEDVALPEFCGS